jgi:putative endonuclease
MASKSGVLYAGITNDIERRVHEHKNGVGSVFTTKYAATRLVHVEEFDSAFDAIAREKEIKGWVRKKKLDLVRSENPKWEDLSAT